MTAGRDSNQASAIVTQWRAWAKAVGLVPVASFTISKLRWLASAEPENAAAARPTTATVPVELGGTTKTPGVYESPAGTFGITGVLTLDAQGDPDAVFIFKAASTLITASASSVDLTGGAQSSNVFWLVGSSATLGTYSILRGTIMALASITVTTGVTVDGRALARTAAVTLDTDTISITPTTVDPHTGAHRQPVAV